MTLHVGLRAACRIRQLVSGKQLPRGPAAERTLTMMGRTPGLQRPQTAAQKAILDKNGKRRSSLATKTADDAFQRYEEAWFNFHRFDKDGNGFIDKEELAELLMDLKMHVARAHRSEEQMAKWVAREIQKNDANGDGVLSFAGAANCPSLCTHERVRAFSPILLCVHDFVPAICIRCRVPRIL